ncbi:MAG: enoyl-CoA hydratase/isomerase family protein [Rhodanobacteraceae bacterium]|nr:enoyl-CoA hydratase/isomerase family protein [Rhodanobacteraceae bacterium]
MAAMVRVGLSGRVATVTMDRPDVHNAFNAELIAELTAALARAGADPEVRAVVLAAEGKSFSAGADLNWMRAMAAFGEAENQADALKLADLMRTLAYLPKPTIARIQGSAFGGGVGLIACCDVALASDEARFGLTESKLGLVPAVISPYVVAAIGARHARRWFQSGALFDAPRALAMNLVHEIMPADALDGAVERELDAMLKAGPTAMLVAKRLVEGIFGRDEPAQRKLDEQTAALIARLRVSMEGQEGLTAFLEKRPPNWL